MATEELILMGSSVINDPEGYATDAQGTENDGAYLTGGDMVFDNDDIVVFVAENVTPAGALSDQSIITDIIVYDSAADYVNGNALYTYSLSTGSSSGNGQGAGRNWTGGQTGDVSTTVYNMGDNYLHFRATHFECEDPNAPALNYMLLAPGVDLTSDLPLFIPHIDDTDYNGNGTIDNGNENGNGVFETNINIFAEETIANTVCLVRGTLIDTPNGPRYIETLSEGDLVHTLDYGPQPIRWIGSRRVQAEGHLAPILIKRGALGNLRDLKVSPNHRMMIRGAEAELLFGERDVLVAAKHLVNDDTIRRAPGGFVDYFHMLFDAHQIIFAEACPTESLFPGQETLSSVDEEAKSEILTLFPELETKDNVVSLARYELRSWEAKALKMAC
ncbi:Hint domain-containing protein [Celeribacter litoreus]|uniref:Hint domain-containing protein n=1 Tax=Celeribacter litoreus TaxID=2876714 RepID=UPI001CCE76B3|nr:Hint domain-containing protein [Celeribacter litoreus]MCA0043114.1 Hint domain-containing protein [Celeribacter litoreus]